MNRPGILLTFLILTCLFFQNCHQDKTQKISNARNIILISIDTLRPDALSVYGGKTSTPFFDQFARRSVVFDHALTCVPITLPAHTSLLTGLYPPSHGVRNNGTFQASSSLNLISEMAHQNGMATAAVVGGFPLSSRFGLNQGFDSYDDHFPPMESAPGVFLLAERDAQTVRNSAQTWLTSHGERPFFLWVHFFDPHHPYREHGMNGVQPYEQEVLYVDQELTKFFQFLQNHKWDESSLIILTADHGEAFGEHGEVSHTLFVYNTTLKIPLMISAPGISARRVPDLARIIDVFPTICEAMGSTVPQHLDGVSLLALLQGEKRPAVTSYAETLAPALDFGWSPLFSIQDSSAKYIQAPHPEYYDLAKDPGELQNIISSAHPQAFQSQIHEIVTEKLHTSVSRTLTAEEREQMESLGYLSSGSAKIRKDAPDPKDKIEVARKIAELTGNPMSLADKAKAYGDLVAQDPENPLLLLRYAEVLLKLERIPEAGRIYQHLLDAEYPSVEVYNGLAACLFYAHHVNDAEKILNQAMDMGLGNGKTCFNLAELAFNRGDRDLAFKYYDRSIDMGYLESFYRKARLMEITGSYPQALALLRRAEGVSPESSVPNSQAALLYFKHAEYAQALTEFKKALAKSPNDVSLLYNIGVTYSKIGDSAECKAVFAAVLERGAKKHEGPAQFRCENPSRELIMGNQMVTYSLLD